MNTLSLSRPAQGSTNWFGAVDGNWANLQAIINGLMAQNVLLNGGFDFFQRTGPSPSTGLQASVAGTYGPDRWYILTDDTGTNVLVSRSNSGSDTGAQNFAVIKNNHASNTYGIAIAQIVEAANSLPFAGLPTQFQFRFQMAGSGNITVNASIYEYTSNPDGSTNRNILNSTTPWTSHNPNFSSTPSQVGTTAQTYALGSGWTDVVVTGTPTTASNLVVIIWITGGVAATKSFNVTKAGLYGGILTPTGTTRPWLPRPIQQELAMCQRYFCSSGLNSALPITCPSAGSLYIVANYPTAMRIFPTVTLNVTAGTYLDYPGNASSWFLFFQGSATSKTGGAITVVGQIGLTNLFSFAITGATWSNNPSVLGAGSSFTLYTADAEL